MSKRWNIENVSALVVDGVKFELQDVSYKVRSYDTDIRTVRMWVKSANQDGRGFVIGAPMYLPDEYWTRLDDYGNMITTKGVVYKERTWIYYGTAGYETGTPTPITTLSPWAKEEVSGKVLAFEGLRINVFGSKPDLFINGKVVWDLIVRYSTTGRTYMQFYGLHQAA